MAVTRTDKEFQPLDALARALEAGYELKLDRQLREHLDDWLHQWKLTILPEVDRPVLTILPEVDRPVDMVFNDDSREVVLVPGKTHPFRLTAECRYRGWLPPYDVATLELGGRTCKVTYWGIVGEDMDYTTRSTILSMLKNY